MDPFEMNQYEVDYVDDDLGFGDDGKLLLMGEPAPLHYNDNLGIFLPTPEDPKQTEGTADFFIIKHVSKKLFEHTLLKYCLNVKNLNYFKYVVVHLYVF